MNQSFTVANWALLYTAELISFSIVLIFLARSELKRPIIYWIISNITAALGMLTPSTFVEVSNENEISYISFFLSSSSIIAAYFALNYGQKISRIHAGVISLILISWFVGALLPYGWFSSSLVYTAGSLWPLISAAAVYANPQWRGLRGRDTLAISFVACAGLIFWRGMIIFAYRNGEGFLIDEGQSALGMRILVGLSFLIQISFLSVVISSALLRRRKIDQDAAKEFEISRAIAQEQKEIQALADERLDMISLLTHEVRQPINNAQAALEALDLELQAAGASANETRRAVIRSQTVLDRITLAISNAIVGVSLIDEDGAIQTRPIDALEIAELACSDCPAEQQYRIRIMKMTDTIFVDLDPILIRLALRNLLDNALKYSKLHSVISIEIRHDEERLGVSFLVSNYINDASSLSQDIFQHRVRGNAGRVEGSGHGLFLVKRVADAHHGQISFTVTDESKVTFDLFIPD